MIRPESSRIVGLVLKILSTISRPIVILDIYPGIYNHDCPANYWYPFVFTEALPSRPESAALSNNRSAA